MCKSGKIEHTKKEAQTQLNVIAKKQFEGKYPIRKYHCTECNMWHLTSSENKSKLRWKVINVEQFKKLIDGETITK